MTGAEQVRARLEALADPAYRTFQCRLMPAVDPASVLGVRMPALRRFARELRGTDDAAAFLRCLPHETYDENNLHGLLICELREYGEAVAALDEFLTYVDNWATCDLLSPKAFVSRPPQLAARLRAWMADGREYAVRFALAETMRLYVQRDFDPAALEWAAAVPGGTYYIDMMLAWFFATALTHQYGAALPYLTDRRLSRFVHNKTIQKAVESRCIPPDRKQALRALRF